MASRLPGRMSEILTREISLVKKPANKREFLLTKNQEETMEELLKVIREAQVENEEALISFLKSRKLSDEAINATTAFARIANAYSDELDRDVFVEVAKSVGFELATETEDTSDNGDVGLNKSDLEKVPAELRDKLVELEKRRQEDRERMEALEKAMANAEAEKELARHVERARELSNLARTAEEIGSLLKKTADSGGQEAADELFELLAAANESANQNLFDEVGSHRGSTGDVAQQLDAIAKELRKSDSSLSAGEAFDRALSQNPKLAREYRASLGSRTNY